MSHRYPDLLLVDHGADVADIGLLHVFHVVIDASTDKITSSSAGSEQSRSRGNAVAANRCKAYKLVILDSREENLVVVERQTEGRPASILALNADDRPVVRVSTRHVNEPDAVVAEHQNAVIVDAKSTDDVSCGVSNTDKVYSRELLRLCNFREPKPPWLSYVVTEYSALMVDDAVKLRRHSVVRWSSYAKANVCNVVNISGG